MAFNPKCTITNVITEALTRIERARGFLESTKLSEGWIRQRQERTMVLEVTRRERRFILGWSEEDRCPFS
jgi:hypothetical protein